jgi:exopolysaccharide biosynthesis polyprenyl glycosylphosphotransferase
VRIEQRGPVEGGAERRTPRDPASIALPDRDVRRKRPLILRLLLRWDTARRVGRILSLVAIDVVGVAGALFTSLAVKGAIHDDVAVSAAWSQTRHWGVFACLITLLLFARADLYADRPARPGLSRITTALFQVTVVSLVFALASGEHFSSYFVFYGTLFFATVYVGALRELHMRATGWLLAQAGYERRALLVGSGKHIDEVAKALATRSRTRVEVTGYISLAPRPANGLRSLGQLDDLPRVLVRERIQEVIIADPDFPQDKAVELVDLCHRQGVTVQVAPSTMEILIERAEFVPGGTVPLFTLRPPVFAGIDFALKRTFDLVISVVLLTLLSPLLLAIAIAVKLTSSGPVIYRSVRPGMAGRPFDCFKFRTMYEHSEQTQARLESLNEQTGALFKIRRDPRLTSVGRLLRRFSLDEVPQLVNVVLGEMSLVGPRPLPMRDFHRLEEWHKKRYLVLPGITGLWQVSGRSELDFDDLVRLDFLYLERWSIMLDLSILLKTIPAVLSRKGAF